MKRCIIKLSSLLLMLLSGITATAYDFMVDGLAYIINNDGTTVSVTSSDFDLGNNYSGLTNADIPASVT